MRAIILACLVALLPALASASYVGWGAGTALSIYGDGDGICTGDALVVRERTGPTTDRFSISPLGAGRDYEDGTPCRPATAVSVTATRAGAGSWTIDEHRDGCHYRGYVMPVASGYTRADVTYECDNGFTDGVAAEYVLAVDEDHDVKPLPGHTRLNDLEKWLDDRLS